MLHNSIPKRIMSIQRRKHIKFSYKDIADLKGVSIHAVHKAIQTKRLNPDSLLSIINYLVVDKRTKGAEFYVDEYEK